MNKQRRAALTRAADLLGEASIIVWRASEEEQECFDNLSENLQSSERGLRFEEVAESLSEAGSAIDDAVITIEEARDV